MIVEIIVEKENEVYLRLICEPSVRMELNHYFRFRPKDYQFMPMFRRKKWDGFVYLFNMDNGRMYYGLKPEVQRFAYDREYIIIDQTNIEKMSNPYLYANLLIYPSFEIFFSIFRKLLFKNNPLKPDQEHLHQLLLLYYLKFSIYL